jgi:hypothetical protein
VIDAAVTRLAQAGYYAESTPRGKVRIYVPALFDNGEEIAFKQMRVLVDPDKVHWWLTGRLQTYTEDVYD